eukprot:7458354-Pyramimonas_sp.AAC.1
MARTICIRQQVPPFERGPSARGVSWRPKRTQPRGFPLRDHIKHLSSWRDAARTSRTARIDFS